MQSDKNASLCKEPQPRRKQRQNLNGLHAGKLTIYMRKPEIVIGESKFVPFRLWKEQKIGLSFEPIQFL